MLATRLLISAVLALPAGWLAGLLADRVPPMGRTVDGELRDPDALKLFEQLPGLRFHGRYRWIHLVVLGLYIATAYRFQDTSAMVLGPYLVWWCGLTALVATDLECQRLPDRIVLPTFVIGLVTMVVVSLATSNAVSIRYALAGSAGYFGVLLVLHLIYPGFAAFGDVKTAAIVGMAAAWVAVSYTEVLGLTFWAILISYVLSALVGIGLVMAGGVTAARRRRIGMGPWMLSGCFIVVMFSSSLV